MKAYAVKPIAQKTLTIAAAALVLMALAYVVAHGTLKTFGLGIAAALAVPLGYLAIERPLLFPFGLYVALVPFEDMLNFAHVGTINKLLGILAFGAILFAILRKGEIAKPSPAVFAWMAVGVWMGVSGFWTLDIKAWQAAYITFAQLFLLYALMSVTLTNKGDVKVLCTCIVLGGLLAAAVSVWPFLHGNFDGYQGRLTLPGGTLTDRADPNQFAASLLLPFGIIFAATLATRRPVALIGNVAGVLLLAITLVLTGSRAAMLSVIVLVLYMLLKSRHRVVGVGLLILSAIAVVPFGMSIQSRFATALSSGGAGRTDIWRVALIAFKDHWLYGSGFASFPAVFDTAVLKAPLQMYIGWHRAPHDLLVATSVELGVIGLGLVIFALYMEFSSIARLPHVDGFMGDLAIALQATLIGICIDALFLDITNRKYLWLLFIMIALVRSTVLNAVDSQRERRRTTCAILSSDTPALRSLHERSNESSNLLRTAG